jgi:cell division protein FtsW
MFLKQPDFGSALVLGIVTASLLGAGNVPFLHLSTLVPLSLVVCYKAVYRVQYRWERIKAFIDPWASARDSGYQLIQAWIALGSGGVLGKGLGAGQQKLFFLPEPYTDFILAVVGEELGLTGILAICILFFLIGWIGIQIAQGARDHFGGLLALGLTLLLTLQALINMAVVVGLFPTKGLPLPFISYGGSALIANCLATGILLNIAARRRFA